MVPRRRAPLKPNGEFGKFSRSGNLIQVAAANVTGHRGSNLAEEPIQLAGSPLGNQLNTSIGQVTDVACNVVSMCNVLGRVSKPHALDST